MSDKIEYLFLDDIQPGFVKAMYGAPRSIRINRIGWLGLFLLVNQFVILCMRTNPEPNNFVVVLYPDSSIISGDPNGEYWKS